MSNGVGHRTVRLWRAIGLGVLIALAAPISYLALAKLIESGIVAVPSGPFNDLIKSLGLNASVGFILAVVGLGALGRGAGLQSPWAWLVVLVLGLPMLMVVWFFGYAILGGATGSPF
jgi:hypothetical protein